MSNDIIDFDRWPLRINFKTTGYVTNYIEPSELLNSTAGYRTISEDNYCPEMLFQDCRLHTHFTVNQSKTAL